MKKLTSSDLKLMFPEAIVRTYPKGQVLLYQHDTVDTVFFIINGDVKYYDIDDQGFEKIIHILGPGSVFPTLYVFDAVSELLAFYATLNEVEVLAIPKEDFVNKVHQQLDLANNIISWNLKELREVTKRIGNLMKTDSYHKVAYALTFLAENHSSSTSTKLKRINFQVNQQMIADLAGITRETVSGVMQEFEAKKIIRIPKQLVLDINLEKLKALQPS